MRLLLLLFIFNPILLLSQSFIKISDSPVSTLNADSRACNFVDVNNDDWLDIFISNGASGGQDNQLFLNDGTGKFTLMAEDDISNDNGSSDGAAFADVDNDGDLDAFVVTWYGQKNYFYLNNGDGTFTYLEDALTANTGTHSEACAWGDYDNDGLVDLLLTNSEGNKRNFLFHNTDGSNFERINTPPFSTDNNTSRAISWTDYDSDQDLDLYICNEANEKNLLYKNEGAGVFTKITTNETVTDNNSSMSSSWGDVDNDGDLDLFVANAGYFQELENELYINNGDGSFSKAENTTFSEDGGCSYSSSFADYDNDGDIDLLVTNGYCNANLQEFLYINDGQGNFYRATNIIPDLPIRCSYGCAWGDYNNDGFLDLVIAHCKNNNAQGEPTNSLYQNTGNENHWIKLKLEGTVSNRSAIGAKVRIKATINGQVVWQMREISTQSGHCSQNSMKAHFGLGEATLVDSLIIEWPSGITNKYVSVPVDTCILFQEDIADAVFDNQAQENNFICYPNPGKDQITVEAILDKPVKEIQLSLIDMEGRKLFVQLFQQQGNLHFKEIINLKAKNIKQGIYVCQLEGENINLTKKIIVSN
jgi:hypothetical protein